MMMWGLFKVVYDHLWKPSLKYVAYLQGLGLQAMRCLVPLHRATSHALVPAWSLCSKLLIGDIGGIRIIMNHLKLSKYIYNNFYNNIQ